MVNIKFGDVLILREYKKEDKKAIPLPSLPVPLLASKSTSEPSDIVVYHCSDAITKQGPLKITLDPEDTLSKVVKDACSRFGGDPAAAHICRVGYSADSDDYLSYVELNKADTADMTHMTSGDTLYVRFDPPFKTFSDKFGACDKLELMTYSMLCHCHNNPIHRGWKCSESPLQTAAARLGIEKEESEDINNKALDHAKYGVDAVLVELEDRMRNTRFNPFYASNSFENPNLYKKWFEEQRAEILGLMETAISNDYPFCCELHVKVISGAGLLAADIGGTSDPYCTVIYKTQRKSTSRVK